MELGSFLYVFGPAGLVTRTCMHFHPLHACFPPSALQFLPDHPLTFRPPILFLFRFQWVHQTNLSKTTGILDMNFIEHLRTQHVDFTPAEVKWTYSESRPFPGGLQSKIAKAQWHHPMIYRMPQTKANGLNTWCQGSGQVTSLNLHDFHYFFSLSLFSVFQFLRVMLPYFYTRFSSIKCFTN